MKITDESVKGRTAQQLFRLKLHIQFAQNKMRVSIYENVTIKKCYHNKLHDTISGKLTRTPIGLSEQDATGPNI
jgi:hypothetical protein